MSGAGGGSPPDRGRGMFGLRAPCADCPFRRGMGERHRLTEARLDDILDAPACQRHESLDQDGDAPAPGNRPVQCAGLMALLHQAGRPNQIMQVAQRLGAFDPDILDARNAYAGPEEARRAHRRGPGT